MEKGYSFFFLIFLFKSALSMCTYGIYDIMYVVDSSSSIDPHEFSLLKEFLHDFSYLLRIDDGYAKVGMTRFTNEITLPLSGDNTHVLWYFDKRNPVGFEYKVHSGRKLDEGLNVAYDEMYNDNTRPSVKKVVLVITNGESTNPTEDIRWGDSFQKKDAKVMIVGVGVSNVVKTHLKSLLVDDKYFYEVEDFGALSNVNVSKYLGKYIPCGKRPVHVEEDEGWIPLLVLAICSVLYILCLCVSCVVITYFVLKFVISCIKKSRNRTIRSIEKKKDESVEMKDNIEEKEVKKNEKEEKRQNFAEVLSETNESKEDIENITKQPLLSSSIT